MLPLTEHYLNECIRLVGQVRDEAVLGAVTQSKDKEMEYEFLLLKYKAVCITLDKIHNALVEIGGLAKDERKNYLIINLNQDEDEIETQAN
jgi:hypothetical protein